MSKTHTINNNDFLGSLVDGSLGGEVISTSSLDSGLVNGDNGTVGVGNKAVAVASAVAVRSNSSSGVETTSKAASSSEVVSTGSSHGRLVGRDDSTVGVGDQVGVEVQGARVAVADCRDGGDGRGSGNSRGGDNRSGDGRGSNSNGSDGSVLGVPGSEVVSTGSSHSGLIDGDNSTVGVTDQVGVQVEGAGVAIASSVDGSSSDGRGSNSRGSDGRGRDGGGSGISNTSIAKSSTTTTSSKVLSTGGGNCRLVDRHDGSVGVADKPVLGGGKGDTRGENLKGKMSFHFPLTVYLCLYQELHCCVLELKLKRISPCCLLYSASRPADLPATKEESRLTE